MMSVVFSGPKSFISLVIFCNEMIGFIKHILKGISFEKEEMIIDVIEKVGLGGNFLEEEHRFRNFKILYYSELFYYRRF